MLLADGLSRLPNKKNKEVIDLDLKVNFVHFSTEKLMLIHQVMNAEPALCDLRNGFYKAGQKLLENCTKMLGCTGFIEMSILFKGDRILIPESMQPEIMEKIHYGHQGSDSANLEQKAASSGVA